MKVGFCRKLLFLNEKNSFDFFFKSMGPYDLANVPNDI